MSPDSLDQKLALLREQTKTRSILQERRHEERKQEILLQSILKNNNQSVQVEESIEVIKLKHNLDLEVRQRDRADSIFYKNLDIQEFIKTQQLNQNHLLEEIHHTTVSTILEKAILMILESRLDGTKRADIHEKDKDKKKQQTDEQIRLEQFRAELALKYGEEKAEDILNILKENVGEWEKEYNRKYSK